MEMESTLFCVFCHFLCDLFEELATLSLTLQKNDLILPQATSALKKTVTRLEALKINPKPGGLLEKIQTSFAQQRGDEMCFQVGLEKISVKDLREIYYFKGYDRHHMKQSRRI